MIATYDTLATENAELLAEVAALKAELSRVASWHMATAYEDGQIINEQRSYIEVLESVDAPADERSDMAHDFGAFF